MFERFNSFRFVEFNTFYQVIDKFHKFKLYLLDYYFKLYPKLTPETKDRLKRSLYENFETEYTTLSTASTISVDDILDNEKKKLIEYKFRDFVDSVIIWSVIRGMDPRFYLVASRLVPLECPVWQIKMDVLDETCEKCEFKGVCKKLYKASLKLEDEFLGGV